VFGEYDISGDLESKRSVSKNVKRVIVHRQYDAATFENDLALLELESPVRYDTHIGEAVELCMLIQGQIGERGDTQFRCLCSFLYIFIDSATYKYPGKSTLHV
jgi:hypothetical protein